MFGPMFDWTFAAVLAVVSVVLLIGKGDAVLKLLNGSRKIADKKRSEADKVRYSRAMGVFTGVLALDEAAVALFPENQWVMIANIIVAVIAIAAIGSFSKKYK